ncbi:GxxExxY protein [Prosthecobacter sp.]|uniref:GxxExxY protein n=1 Tax=Prosthecobacter sp. TaxID=1965333 RepID=UPI00378417C5
MPSSSHPDLGSDLTKRVIGAGIAVHRTFGPGLDEADYEHALHLELDALGIEHQCQVPQPLSYHGEELDCGYRLDLVISGQLVLELKAVEKIHPVHEAQVFTYLRLSSLPLGLLMNFNTLILRDGIFRRASSLKPASRFQNGILNSENFDDLSREVLAAGLEVRYELGHGLLRSAYEACLVKALSLKGIRTEINLPANLIYRDQLILSRKEVPMIVEDSLMVVCHCVKELGPLQLARDRSLLKASGVNSGLCLNFHSDSLVTEIHRIHAHAKG